MYKIWKCEYTVRERHYFGGMTVVRSEMCNWFRQNPKLRLRQVCIRRYASLVVSSKKPYLLLALGICLESSSVSEDLHHQVLC